MDPIAVGLQRGCGIRQRTHGTHFVTKTAKNVRTEMRLCVLTYTMKRMIQITGIQPLIAAIRT